MHLRNLGLALAAAVILAPVSTAEAGIPVPIEVTCPLTGQTFTYTSTASYSIWNHTLDGQPEGSWTFPMPIPQCPDSRFPALQDMTPEQIEAARALVQTSDYQAVRDENAYYVLAFVMERLSMGEPLDHAWSRLQASWTVRDQPERYALYAGAFITGFDAVSDEFQASNPDNWLFIQTFAANAERQMGRFDDASARLDRLEAAGVEDENVIERIRLTRELLAGQDRRSASPERD